MRRTAGRFIVAIALAAIFHLGLLWGVVVVLDGERPEKGLYSKPQRVAISYVNSDELMNEIELFDPRPLLIPTEWNFANAQYLSDVLQEETPIFSSYEPMYRAEAGDFITTFGDRWEGIESYEGLRDRLGERLFAGLGSVESEMVDPLKNAIEVSVYKPSTGERVFHEVHYNNAAEELAGRWPDWRPARFLASVRESFLTTRMNVLESSGYEEVDRRLETLLSSRLIGKGLFEDGPYLVEVGP